MTENQTKIFDQMSKYVGFCSNLEKQNDGLSQWFMQQDKYTLCRTLENQIESYFQQDTPFPNIMQLIVKLRNCWMEATNDYKEKALHG